MRETYPVPRRFRVTPEEPLEGAVDEEERIAQVPEHLTTKGMYLDNLVSRLEPGDVDCVWPELLRPPRHRKYQPFLDYPLADAVRWLHAVAHRAYPDLSLLEALRRLGRDTVRVFLDSRAGRVVRTMKLGPRESLLGMPKMWKATDPQHGVTASEPAAGVVRFEVDGFPGWLDCGVIGTLEQVVLNHRAVPAIDVELRGPALGVFDVTWQA